MTLVVFNTVTACFMAFMCSMTIFSPKQFMEGGVSNIPWFKNIPEDPRHRVFYTAVFLAIVCICGGVVPTIVSTGSGLICLQNAILFVANFIHVVVLLGTKAYNNIKPDVNTPSFYQWLFMMVVTAIFSVWGLGYYQAYSAPETSWLSEVQFNGPVSIRTANIVGIIFSSIFGFQFVFTPQHLLSAFWTDTDNVEGKKFLGFPLIQTYQGELFWARNSGITILGLNLGGLIYGITSPLLTLQLLLITSVLTLFNFNQIIMQPYGQKSTRNILISWIPTIILCAGNIGVSALALQV